MAEVLTKSFCERCGTRYTFESAKPRVKRLKGVKVLSRGLKNFVLSDDSSLDEAMAAARSDTEREVTSQQLDAFHKTFNFCMTCRQYTCANCWNDAEGTCLTCSPHLGHEIMPAPFPDLDPLGTTVALGALDVATADGAAATNGANGNGHAAPAYDAGAWPSSDAWPSHDLTDDTPAADVPTYASADDDEIDAVARMAALTAIGSGQVATPDPVEAEPEPEVEALAEATPAAEPIVEPLDVAPVALPAEAIVATEPEPEAPIAAAAVEPDRPTEPEAPAVAEVARRLRRRRAGPQRRRHLADPSPMTRSRPPLRPRPPTFCIGSARARAWMPNSMRTSATMPRTSTSLSRRPPKWSAPAMRRSPRPPPPSMTPRARRSRPMP